MVGNVGLEPTRYCYQQILSLVNGSVYESLFALLFLFNWGFLMSLLTL